MIIVDAHLDLAFGALRYGRDLRLPLAELRQWEERHPTDNGVPTVTLPELQRGGLGLVFGTLFAMPSRVGMAGDNPKLVYETAAQAHQVASEQLDYYHRLADEEDAIRLVGDEATLEQVIASQTSDQPLLGIVPLMEGADPIREAAEVEQWHERGLRLIGPAWDDTRYASGAWRGTREGFSPDGRVLMEIMADLGMILDLTHLSQQAVQEALEQYAGPLAATHSNCRTIAPHIRQRNLTDDHIRLLAERQGAMGIVLFNRFLKNEHTKGERKELVTLEHVVAHIDHVCQLTGTAAHVGLGSDFDGGFGWADIPAEMDSIADLRLIGEQLGQRGYTEEDVQNIMGGNWVRLLRRSFSGA